MDWNQIETKWAVMARRIRADVQCGKSDEAVVLRRSAHADDAAGRIIVTETTTLTIDVNQSRDPVALP